MKSYFVVLILLLYTAKVFAQTDTLNTQNTRLGNYNVKQAFEVESLVPMFLTNGYHFAIGYRYHQFRIRASVINGGSYNAEPAGLKNASDDFKRFYKTSPGIFLGYNIWKNLELYTFLEMHTFAIEQKSTGIQHNIRSNDFGGGISYQFFIGRYFYVQPGVHLYLRGNESMDFNGIKYNIPTADFSPVLRLGVRLWRKY
ncbi:hypothetical protein [Solitalea canadensis]|uniref:DUF3575 domain-containing protein n=1 Tax=Solitalea canadensis (strain ATCC 29591 / DSM 3403 / JCM 21819 / LMG 8368 / NBRC 15130 / NCIMB 12057 / USAM 9D) TaxID=929556 RepID=H8KS11_SOLCM|nr:hypothetical protein [Solitalea canadensis]AFD07799.1 hypothetical protein Solca_2772 [Solitalea canadensis DSM 3403]